MTSKDGHAHFSRIVLASLVLGVFAVVASSVALDSYGLFRSAYGRSPRVYSGERTSKYLLSERYVPERFDALLLGSSISANWNTKRITGIATYNASISGGNLSEERLIAENVFARGHLKWLILCIHPYVTMTRGRKTEHMTPRDNWSALGSLDLFVAEASELAAKTGLVSDRHNEFGDYNYDNHTTEAGARAAMTSYISTRVRSGKPHPTFVVAPGALDDIRALADEAHASGARVLVVFPPVFEERLAVERDDWEGYWARVRSVLPSDTLYMNFNDPQFEHWDRRISSFQDSGHLRRSCADGVVDAIGQYLSGRTAQ